MKQYIFEHALREPFFLPNVKGCRFNGHRYDRRNSEDWLAHVVRIANEIADNALATAKSQGAFGVWR